MTVSTPQITSAVEAIGPKEARYLLRQNSHNRHVSSIHVATLARDMRAGKWDLNGETVKVAHDGTLIDGQHRMLAIIEAGATVAMVVVRGLPVEAQDTIDAGKVRGMKDVFALHGITSAATLSAGLRFVWSMELGGRPKIPGVKPSHNDLLEYFEKHRDITASVGVGTKANHSAVRYPNSAAVGLHYMMSRIDAHAADQFWDSLSEGVGLLPGSPILQLREQLLKDIGAAHRTSGDYRVAITIKAWNALREDKEVKLLVWKRGIEEYPSLV